MNIGIIARTIRCAGYINTGCFKLIGHRGRLTIDSNWALVTNSSRAHLDAVKRLGGDISRLNVNFQQCFYCYTVHELPVRLKAILSLGLVFLSVNIQKIKVIFENIIFTVIQYSGSENQCNRPSAKFTLTPVAKQKYKVGFTPLLSEAQHALVLIFLRTRDWAATLNIGKVR